MKLGILRHGYGFPIGGKGYIDKLLLRFETKVVRFSESFAARSTTRRVVLLSLMIDLPLYYKAIDTKTNI